MFNAFKTALIGALLMGLVACGKVPAGYEGVKVDLYGDSKGVDTTEAGVGWHFVPPGKELHKFPTFTQNIEWDGSRTLQFQDEDGLELSADVGMSYFVEPGRASDVFIKYRKGISEITDIFMYNMVRNELVNLGSDMTAEQIYSTEKRAMLEAVEKSVREQVSEYGINVEDLFWVGPINLPQTVKDSIDRKIEATQIATQKENEVAQAKADAEKKIAEAFGTAESLKLNALARAEAIELEGKALRSNPSVIKLRELERWNGVYPTTLVTGDGNSPFLMLNGK